MRVAPNEDNTESRPTLRLVRSAEGTASVQLHMPHLTYWSEAMPLERAFILIDRDGDLAGTWDQQTVDVIDGDQAWPTGWPEVSGA
jgi:peroxiredoxin